MRATSYSTTYSTSQAFQKNSEKRNNIATMHKIPGHTSAVITRPRHGKPWIVTYQDHQKGTVRLVGNFNEKGIFTDGTLTYRTDKGITTLKGTFQGNPKTYELKEGIEKKLYTQPNDNATEFTYYNGHLYPCSEHNVGEA